MAYASKERREEGELNEQRENIDRITEGYRHRHTSINTHTHYSTGGRRERRRITGHVTGLSETGRDDK